MKQIESSTKIVSNTSITPKDDFSIFEDIQENTKKPKYNYHSGLTAGILLRDFSIVLTLKKDCPKNTIKTVRGLAKILIEECNWKKSNLYDLLQQVFDNE